MHANTKFEITSINLDDGLARIRFINIHGPVETGQIVLPENAEDTNQNKDIFSSIRIPKDAEGNYISVEDFKNYIAKQYPFEVFEQINNKAEITSLVADSYANIVGEKYDVTVELSNYPVEDI